MLYKASKYIYNVYNSNEDMILFNTRTQDKLKVPQELVDNVKSILDSSKYVIEDINRSKIEMNLVDGGFLVPFDFDELTWCKFKHNEIVYGSDVLSLEILSTTACNFRCTYCFENHKPEKLTSEVEQRIELFLERHIPKCREFRLSWFGGEPLLNFESIVRISSKANMLCKQYGVPMYGEMSTNGYLLTPEILRTLIKLRITDFQVCIDGPESLHNTTRPHIINKDSYQVILRNLMDIKDNIKSRSFKIAIRTNITPKVEPFLEEHLIDISKKFKNDRRFYLLFQCVRDWGGDSITSDQIVEEETSRYRRWYGVASRLEMNSANSISTVPFVGYCPAYRKNGFVINCNGDILKCALAMDTEYKDINTIGYIDKYGRAIIDSSKHSKWIVGDDWRDKCMDCLLFPMCMGGTCCFSKNIKHIISCNLYTLSIIKEGLLKDDLNNEIKIISI